MFRANISNYCILAEGESHARHLRVRGFHSDCLASTNRGTRIIPAGRRKRCSIGESINFPKRSKNAETRKNYSGQDDHPTQQHEQRVKILVIAVFLPGHTSANGPIQKHANGNHDYASQEDSFLVSLEDSIVANVSRKH